MLGKVFFTLLVFAAFQGSAFAQADFDSCNCEVGRFVKTYESHKNKFIEAAKQRLLFSLSQDATLSHNFLQGDSSKYKKLKVFIRPILKLDYEARNYKTGENICKYFVFDTINYESEAAFYQDDKLLFYVSRAHNDCDIERYKDNNDGQPSPWCQGPNSFEQFFYKETNTVDCGNPFNSVDIKKDTLFTFRVDGLTTFSIKNKKIIITGPESIIEDNLAMKYPTKLIEQTFPDKWIRYCARRCPCGDAPWWRFWDWKVFLRKPSKSS